MHEVDYFDAMLALADTAQGVESLILRSYGINIKIFSNAEHVHLCDPQQLPKYLSLLKNRLGVFFSILESHHPSILNKFSKTEVAINNLNLHRDYLRDKKIIKKLKIIQGVLANYVSLNQLISIQKNTNQDINAATICKLSKKQLSTLIKLKKKSDLQLNIYLEAISGVT